MKLNEKQQKFVLDIAKLINYAEQIGVKLTFGEATRTHSQQFLYYYGKEIKETDGELSIVDSKKLSWTMDSMHLLRLAVDFNFFIDGELTYDHYKLKWLGDYWESLNPDNEWGGNWQQNDTPHFQRNI